MTDRVAQYKKYYTVYMNMELVKASELPFEDYDKSNLATGAIQEMQEEGEIRLKIDEKNLGDDYLKRLTKPFYLATGTMAPITVFKVQNVESTHTAGMTTYSAKSNEYAKQISSPNEKIAHLTTKTKIKTIKYTNPALANYFKASLMLDKNETIPLTVLSYGNTKLKLSLHKEIFRQIHFAREEKYTKTSILVESSKPLDLLKAKKIINRLDATVTLCANSKITSTESIITSTSGDAYDYHYQKASNPPDNKIEPLYLDLDKVDTFAKISKFVFEYCNDNILYPFSYPYFPGEYIENLFVKYYISLEAIRRSGIPKKKLQNQEIEDIALLNMFKRTRMLYIKRASSEKLALELRNLRKNYLHTGYFIGDRLNICKGKKLIKTIKINSDWIRKRTYLTKALLFEYIYYLADIDTSKHMINPIFR